MPRIFVEGWDPDFGSSFLGGDLEPSSARVDAGVELDPARWMPLSPSPQAGVEPGDVAFVDGVRRVDAMVWVSESTEAPRLGLCASCAAGMVASNEITQVVTKRFLFTSAAIPSLVTSAGTFEARRIEAAGAGPAELSQELQNALREIEAGVAGRPGGLVVIDGPLSKQHTRAGAIGYIKTHRVSYLDETLTRTVHALRAGERSPLFLTTTSWERYSCYLRLPGAQEHPWAGMVRLEVAGTTALEQARELVNAAQALLPRYASVPHKEPRAPQNLFPIGGLERDLRRRLGDAPLVHRAIRTAAATHSP